MGSTRLPGKVMADLAGEPMLVRHVNRVRRARTLDGVVVATTDRREDDAIMALCHDRGWDVFRGSEGDLLDRYYRAARMVGAHVVVRVTSDCPLIDPSLIDQAVEEFLTSRPDVEYLSNSLPRQTFPRGLDTEVIRFDVLERAWQEDTNPQWREHVTPYVYKNPDKFRMIGLTCEADYSHLRWTVDTPDDLEFVRKIYGHFGHDRFTWREVLSLLEQHPDWIEINRHVRQKVV
jgi:spore coat polysaccharide biosynthesis protein SpsF